MMELPSPERQLANKLSGEKQDIWGWVIYRCTYDDDEGWARFKEIIQQRARATIEESDAPELLNTLKWEFVEDRATLDGASRAYLRTRFKAWAKDAMLSEKPFLEAGNPGSIIPRYSYFVQVDESALKSVVYEAPQPPDDDFDGEGHVNFVDADWVPMSEWPKEYLLHPNQTPEEDLYDPIDGCREENVGWMKMAAWMVGPSFYEAMYDVPEVWYCFYQRPPETSNW